MSDYSVAASWMAEKIRTEGLLSQVEAARGVELRYGSEFIYINRNGNTAIKREVLAAFRTQTEGWVVWNRAAKVWTLRD